MYKLYPERYPGVLFLAIVCTVQCAHSMLIVLLVLNNPASVHIMS